MRTKQPNPRLPLVVAFLLLLPTLVLAQQTPEQAAARYFEAQKAGDWARAAAMTHPRALESFKRMFDELATFAATDSEGVDTFNQMFGVKPGELKTMAPARVFEQVLGRVTTLQPGLREMMSGARFDVVGHVMEGDTAHVVYRLNMTVMEAPVTQTAVISLQRDGAEWKPLLTGDIQNLLAGLRTAMQMQGKP